MKDNAYPPMVKLLEPAFQIPSLAYYLYIIIVYISRAIDSK